MSLADPWPFNDSEEMEVITLLRILRGESLIRLVSHDEDGDWQFLDGEHVFEEDAALLHLGDMVRFDPTLRALADLPVGSYAWRRKLLDPWHIARGEPPNDIA